MINWPDLTFGPINLWSIWHMEPKDKIDTIYYKGYSNTHCEFFPCHTGVGKDFNCLYCYCPLAWLECPGKYTVIETNNIRRKDCSECTLPHLGYDVSWNFIQHWLRNPVLWRGR